jgi:GxxExxY protein
MMMDINKLSSRIIGAAIEVHKALGPGLLESVYEEYKCHELNLQGFSLERQRNNLPKTDGPFYFPASLPC